MKKISLISTLLILACTSVQAQEVENLNWEGNMGFTNGCKFTVITPGTFTFNIETSEFVTTKAATITVESLNRDQNFIELREASLFKKDDDTKLADITVDYSDDRGIESDIESLIGSVNLALIAPTKISAQPNKGRNTTKYTIGGIATLVDLDVWETFENDLEVYIPHQATCINDS